MSGTGEMVREANSNVFFKFSGLFSPAVPAGRPIAPVIAVQQDPEASQGHGPSGSRRVETRIVGCSLDKPMLLISWSHEKQTAIMINLKPRASRDREFYINHRNRNEESSSPRHHLGAEHLSSW